MSGAGALVLATAGGLVGGSCAMVVHRDRCHRLQQLLERVLVGALFGYVVRSIYLSQFVEDRCSSAKTLRIQRLDFGCEQLTKGPNVLRQPCCQRWWALAPAGLHRAAAWTLVRGQQLLQAQVRSGPRVEALATDDPLPQALAVCTAAGRLTRPGGQGRTPGHVHACEQGRAEREAQGRQALGAQHAACPARPPLALGLLFDPLPVAQSGMGRAAGLAEAPPLTGARTRRPHVEGREQGRQRTRDAITKERREARDAGLGGGPNRLGGGEWARPPEGREQPPQRGGNAAPAPWPSGLAVRPACTGRVRLTRLLALDKVPHLGAVSLSRSI